MSNFIGVLFVASLGLGGCTVKECDPDDTDCGVGDADSDADTDSDTGTDDSCDAANWDPVADDTCDDATTLVTCGADGHLESVDCAAECGGAGTCDTHPTEGGFACICGGGECDFATWDNATMDTCEADQQHLRTCVEGDVFESVDCVAECQAAVGQDGVCATLVDEPGQGCVCSAGDTCEPGTADSCIDDDIVERCINGLVITESCLNWCRVEQGLEDGLCNADTNVCDCF